MKPRMRRKAARWSRSGGSSLCVGLPGRAPSPQAQQLAAWTSARFMRPGTVLHISDYAAATFSAGGVVEHEAEHVESGARFRLVSQPDGPILALAALDDAAQRSCATSPFWDDPAHWAAGQRWRILPMQEG